MGVDVLLEGLSDKLILCLSIKSKSLDEYMNYEHTSF